MPASYYFPKIPHIKRRQSITADYLNHIGRNLNELIDYSFPDAVVAQDGFYIGAGLHDAPVAPPDVTGVETLGVEPSQVWVEKGRDTTTVRVENPEDSTQYVNVERIDGVVMENLDGTRMFLIFDNT